MEVGFYPATSGTIINNPTQPFLLISLMGDTFLLTKANPHSAFQKNINFQLPQGSFYSTFSRNVNLLYPKKLSEIIELLSITPNPDLQHQWLSLYEVHNFHLAPTTVLHIKPPSYGSKVVVESRLLTNQNCLISNAFKYSSDAFYFLSVSSSSCQELSVITDERRENVLGVTFFVKEVIVCLPFHEIISEKPCPFLINPSIRPLLEDTCYISYRGNYCTGFVLENKTIISARHVIFFEDQKPGLEVGIRFYPYHEEKTGYIKRIGQKSVDIIEIVVSNQIVTKKEAATIEKCHKSNTFSGNFQPLVGEDIVSLGFGKYGYTSRIFQKIELVMPTIESGIVSKVVNVGHNSVFLKTDAALFNGFSGCGVWLGNRIIGMAIFILKNKNNESNFNRHNFSYTIEFIEKLLSSNSQQMLISSINAELQCFDRIQTRHKIPLMPRL